MNKKNMKKIWICKTSLKKSFLSNNGYSDKYNDCVFSIEVNGILTYWRQQVPPEHVTSKVMVWLVKTLSCLSFTIFECCKKKKKKRRNLKMLFGNFVFSLKYISWQCSKALIGDIVNYCVKQCQYELTDNSLCTEDRNSSHSNVTSLHPRFKVRLSTLGYSFFLFCDRGRHFDCIMVYVCRIIFLLFSTANSLWCAVFVLGLLIYFVQSRKINK